MKGEALADFIWESTWAPEEPSEPNLVHPPDGDVPLRNALVLTFKTKNNEEKYEALITWRRLGKGIGAACLYVYYDSQLVVNQVNGEYLKEAKPL